jgi:hypothetical protein
MAEKEVFATPCWSFIGGDRQIERLLRELPAGQQVVVRNRLANVLPTVASLHDLGRLRGPSPLRLAVSVPENAVAERALGMETVLPAGLFYEAILSRLYGVRVEDEAPGDAETLVLALGYGAQRAPQGARGSGTLSGSFTGHDGEAAALARWLSRYPDARTVFLLARGEVLHPLLRPFAVTAWSAQSWDGLGAFSLPSVEEAVEEAAPERIVVAGVPAAAVAYTAIGAADFFIRRETHAAGRPPGDLRRVGDRVSVLRSASDLGPVGAPAAFGELVKRHLEDVLGVVSTASDARFRVTEEAIAIDIV